MSNGMPRPEKWKQIVDLHSLTERRPHLQESANEKSSYRPKANALSLDGLDDDDGF